MQWLFWVLKQKWGTLLWKLELMWLVIYLFQQMTFPMMLCSEQLWKYYNDGCECTENDVIVLVGNGYIADVGVLTGYAVVTFEIGITDVLCVVDLVSTDGCVTVVEVEVFPGSGSVLEEIVLLVVGHFDTRSGPVDDAIPVVVVEGIVVVVVGFVPTEVDRNLDSVGNSIVLVVSANVSHLGKVVAEVVTPLAEETTNAEAGDVLLFVKYDTKACSVVGFVANVIFCTKVVVLVNDGSGEVLVVTTIGIVDK
ncbi:hypothetical protein scyTo_0008636 [Scyliorhinus torazame]|uniref:Uncharacterized protein n=1 Tax=Scyliorhinus torazame TaxID=75743 RepID=A0A401PC27_SCYTO|nr:hypothetical protein [Scyliorhinus torazame]